MQLITRKNFISIVCTVYTILSLGKIIVETIYGHKDPYYVDNFITIFLASLVATLVLGLHHYLQNIPITIVIIGQYIFLLGIIMLSLWIQNYFQKLAPTAYRDMFLSFTIPYIIGAIIYYVNYMLQLRKANKTLAELKKDGGRKDEY